MIHGPYNIKLIHHVEWQQRFFFFAGYLRKNFDSIYNNEMSTVDDLNESIVQKTSYDILSFHGGDYEMLIPSYQSAWRNIPNTLNTLITITELKQDKKNLLKMKIVRYSA